ncbi:unnamed protein product [Kuraishia capsulata CBS 1993]|uniref:Aldehyde dehydrogenase domain-containing protein n=1 Tax=Kuraishia capsulata CBS 1993 TaxID=1382522 RepID=W6MM22_9ASCO|nr:uncharacterized protein KUCA_T00003529001 [Kuraishia capsulata CBS 1993]CDK27551.1 unnamed protein product [Kuraishia capsulata CBS 1993]
MSLSTTIKLPNGKEYEQPLGLFIGGEYITPEVDSKITVINPSNEEVITEVYAGDKADIDKAVVAARKAFESPEWRGIAASARGDYLYKIAQIIDRDRELIASIDSIDNGKPLPECVEGDLEEAYNVFKYYAGFADKITGKTIETSPEKLAYTVQEPLGVCGQIIPWNYPFMMLAWKVAPALCCGNTVILKPSEVTPLSALYFGKICQEAGLPAGVVNVVNGYGKTAGAALSEHTGVDKIAFTGSTASGKLIMKAAANNLKNVTLECGGKNPLIIFDDAELDQAVKWARIGIFDNKGEVCTSTSRIYVQEAIYDKFLEEFVAHIKDVTVVADPFGENTTQGPQVSKMQYEKVLSYIESGKAEGAKLAYGGAKASEKGYFLNPTVFSDVQEDMKINKEEIFGPVVAVSKFSTVEEVVQKANDTSYGLAAALFSQNVTQCVTVASKLQAGMVWINSNNDSHFGIPFGGYKSSGIGRELGPYALDAYTQTKAVHINVGLRV